MKIQYMSDLHFEFRENSRYIKHNEFPVTGDILVLAGDIFYLKDRVAPLGNFWKTGDTVVPTRKPDAHPASLADRNSGGLHSSERGYGKNADAVGLRRFHSGQSFLSRYGKDSAPLRASLGRHRRSVPISPARTAAGIRTPHRGIDFAYRIEKHTNSAPSTVYPIRIKTERLWQRQNSRTCRYISPVTSSQRALRPPTSSWSKPTSERSP